MSGDLQLLPRLPGELRAEAGALLWQCFAAKLRPVVAGRDAAGLLAGALREDRVVAAVRPSASPSRPSAPGRLLGLAALDDGAGQPLELTPARLREEFGWWSGSRRAMWAAFLQSRPRPGELLLDFLCVADGARGLGVGSALLDAVTEVARERGLGTVRLEVVDTNPRARALYLRHGYQVVRRARVPWVRHTLGFGAYEEMALQVPAAGGDYPPGYSRG